MFWTLCFIDFWTFCFILFVSQTFRRISKQIFLRESVRKPKYSYYANNKPPQRGGAVPFPALGRVEMACQIPEGLILGRFCLGQLFSFFYPCCLVRGHIWTAFLNPIDRPLFLLLSFQQLFLVSSSTPNLLFIYPTHRCFLSLCFFSSAVTFIPILALYPCSICSHRVTWGKRSVQCTNCFFCVHLSCSDLSPADFRKISPGHSSTCPMCPSSSQPPSLSHSNRLPSSTNIPNPPPSLTNTHK